MRPNLLEIHVPFTNIVLPLHSYGFMLALGFIAAIYLQMYQVKKDKAGDPDLVYSLSYWVVISAVLGSRLFHAMVYWEDYASQPWRVFYVWEGGLVYYGGLIAATIAGVLFLRRNKLNAAQWSDFAAPGIALGLAFGRMGCFMVGCCHGKVCPPTAEHCMIFPPDAIGVTGIPVYPTQLWSIIANLSIAAILFFIVRPRKKFHGEVMAVFFILYSIFRITVEFWRGDPRGFAAVPFLSFSGPSNLTGIEPGIFARLVYFDALKEISPGKYIFQLSESQWVSLGMIAVAVTIIVVMRKKGVAPELVPVENQTAHKDGSKRKKGARKK